jgi:hypothetical protein
MSVPTEFDFAILKLGDGGGTEVFAISCGKSDINLSFAANTSDRFVRDCAKPGEIPFRKNKVTGKQMDVTATGLTDKAQFGVEVALLGKKRNIKVEYYTDDGSDAGVLLGTVACNMAVTSLSVSAPRDGDSSAEIGLASNGAWTWTAV